MSCSSRRPWVSTSARALALAALAALAVPALPASVHAAEAGKRPERPAPPKGAAAKTPPAKDAPKPAAAEAPKDAAAEAEVDEKPDEATTAAAAPAPADAAPVATAETEKEGEVFLTQALSAASFDNWRDAARLAHAALTKIPENSEKHEPAQLALADALAQLGFEQAAAEYYFNIIERRQTPQLLPRALEGVERLSRKRVISEAKLIKGVLVEADLANVPPDVADFLHYHRGLANLRLGNARWKDHDFASLRPGSWYGRRARIADAVGQLRAGKLEEATAAIEALLAEKPEADIEREARLIRARLLFEGKKPKDAMAEYRRVGSTRDVPGGQVLLERAWSHYQAGEFHDSMGLLYALGAPAHKDLFLPDAYVLRGLIYQRFCHFRAAKGAVAAFRERYGPSIQELQDGKRPEDVKVVSEAARVIPSVAGTLRVHEDLLAEQKLVGSSGFVGPALQKHLEALYVLLEQRSTRETSLAVQASAAKVAEGLLIALEQANLLEYEVGVSIHRRVQDAAGKAYVRSPPQIVPPKGEDIFYKFNGEFWSDELPDMRFLIQDRCVE